MKIAVCDGNENHLNRLKLNIYKYSALRQLETAVDCYTRGSLMLISKERYEIIFLNCDFLTADKFEIAKAIRNNNRHCAIVFISSDIHCVSEAFKVNAFNFLIYPVKQTDLFSILDEYFNKTRRNHPVWIRSGDDTLCRNAGEILYLEADNKNCYVHLEKETLKSNCTMAKFYTGLDKKHFLKINRAYIINCDYISRYNNDAVTLKNGDKLHISRNYLKDFKSNYHQLLTPLTIT